MDFLTLEDGNYKARMIKDSYSPSGVRLSTMELTFPRFILAEVNTHKILSKNSSSSRARPIEKILKVVQENPFIPEYWGKNQKGMQAFEELSITEQELASKEWIEARDDAFRHAENLLKIGVHKQITNRLLEPFMWHTALITGTEWMNMIALRTHKDAQPEFRRIALLTQELYNKSNPEYIRLGEWHLPLVSKEELTNDQNKYDTLEDKMNYWKRVSAGRCCRVSYMTHDGKRDPQADIDLCAKLIHDGHYSPVEHMARPMTPEEAKTTYATAVMLNEVPHDEWYLTRKAFCKNYRGWIQFRNEIPNESDFSRVKPEN